MERFKDYERGLVLRLLKRDENRPFITKEPKEYLLKGADRAIMKFSDDGTILALFT